MTTHDLLFSLLDAALCALAAAGVKYLHHLAAEKAHDRIWTACFRAVASVEQQFVKTISHGDKKAAAIGIARALLPPSVPSALIGHIIEAALYEMQQDRLAAPPLASDPVHLMSLVHAEEIGGMPS